MTPEIVEKLVGLVEFAISVAAFLTVLWLLIRED